MNKEHEDIEKIVPYGEQLRGFANQKFISPAELHRILKERGVFTLTTEKDYMVPLLQTLLLSPKEFDKIREAFSTKEDNNKIISRDIKWNQDVSIYSSDIILVDVDNFIKQKLPTCKLEQPIRFAQVENNPNHLRAEFFIQRNDINKSWFQQTNIFSGSIEFINENNGNGRVIISHTAPETKEIAEYVVKEQIKKYKNKRFISETEELKKIIFSDFTNETRFAFFYRLTNHLECDYFRCENIKDISIRPEEGCLPQEIKWMEDTNKILLSGNSLDKKNFMKENKYYKHLILWNIDASFSYNYRSESGTVTVSLGFPEYSFGKKENVEFEINISTINSSIRIDGRAKQALKKQLLAEMDRQKSIVYNKFLEYKKTNKE
jgi:hypothetical protein